jgi:hypothetical protein
VTSLEANQPQSAVDIDTRERIASSGLFDAAFYRETYGPLPAGEDPLAHFLSTGLASGYVPSERFDPALYRLAVPAAGSGNPLLHYLASEPRISLPSFEAFFAPLIAKYANKRVPVPPPSPHQLRRHRAYRDEFARARTLRFDIGGHDYRIVVPSAEFFFDRLRDDRPFAFARLPHGFWDGLALCDYIAAEPQLAPLGAVERRSLARRIAQRVKPHDGSLAEGFSEEMAAIARQHQDDPRFFNAVAFKGFPTPDEDLFAPWTDPDNRADRLARLAEIFRPETVLYDATLWKRLAYSGDLLRLPETCRDRHVVLIANDLFRDLGKRWQLSRFTHIEIPRRLSHRIRWQLLEQLQRTLTTIKQSGQRPMVISRCGGSLAFWLIKRLFSRNPEIAYLDLGQALDIWFTDERETRRYKWMRYYTGMKPSARVAT